MRVLVWMLAMMLTPGLVMGAGKSQPDAIRQMVLDLRDGSRVVGAAAVTSIPIRASFAEVHLPLSSIGSMDLSRGPDAVEVRCINGDVVHGDLRMETLVVNTVFGRVSIALSKVTRISFSSGFMGLTENLKRGLLAYYSFDQDDGAVVVDRSGNQRDGRVHGARWVSEGAAGGVMEFNGVNSSVEIPVTGYPAGNAPRTLAAWVRQNRSQARQEVVGYGGGNTGREFSLALNLFRPGQVSLDTYNGTWDSSASLSVGRWYHIAVTYGSGQQPKFYLDGIECSLENMWGSPSIHTLTEGGAMGMRFCTAEKRHLDGRLDDVGMWNRELSADEIRWLYRQRSSDFEKSDLGGGAPNR